MAGRGRPDNFFGVFLLARGVVSESQLEDALMAQKAGNARLGDMAVESGNMRPEDVEAVCARQLEVDSPFGEIAVEMGFLSRRELEELLFTQSVRNRCLGEILVDRGHVGPERLGELLDEFSDLEQQRDASVEDSLGDTDEYVAVTSLVRCVQRAFARFTGGGIKVEGVCGHGVDIRTPICIELDAQGEGGFGIRFRFHLSSEIAGAINGDNTFMIGCRGLCREFFGVVCRYLESALEDKGYRLKRCALSECRNSTEDEGGISLRMAIPSGGALIIRAFRPKSGP